MENGILNDEVCMSRGDILNKKIIFYENDERMQFLEIEI